MVNKFRVILGFILPSVLTNYLLKMSLLLRAKISNNCFYCNALQGNSIYNICINSDMTVSCNCQDYDGSGQIGNLDCQTFEEIFKGDVAQSFRNKLAAGKLPIKVCSQCPELKMVKKKEINGYLSNFNTPSLGIMVENTVLCNLSCLGCKRKQILKTRNPKTMSLENIQKVGLIISKHNINHVSFFNLGEPFIVPNIHMELNILRKLNPNTIIITSTNGVYLDSDEKRKAALQLNHIYMSIDGPSQEIIQKYQVGGDFKKSYENLKKLVEYRNNAGSTCPTIEWKYVMVRWNDKIKHIEEAIHLAKEAGVDSISFWLGGAPPSYRSIRYHFSPYYRRLGNDFYEGKKIDFRH